MTFRAGSVYDNVYLLFVDAADSSGIVAGNPRDHATEALDRLRDQVLSRVAGRGAARAELWSWRGDGGLFVVHDEHESIARDVALSAGIALLTVDLPAMRESLRPLGLRGELRVRVAVHKATIDFPGAALTGSIHSPEIDFAAHLEAATPTDCMAISDEVRRVAGDFAADFEPVGSFQGRPVHVLSAAGKPGDAARAWLGAFGLADGSPVLASPERPSQREKARLVDAAVHEIVSIGTAHNAMCHYLTSTERPASFRTALLGFLARGGIFRCVQLDPGCRAAELVGELRGEDLRAKIEESLAGLARFKRRHDAHGFEVHRTSSFAGFAAMAIDDGLILHSPYLLGTLPVERGDMPHYLLTPADGRLFADVRTTVALLATPANTTRVL